MEFLSIFFLKSRLQGQRINTPMCPLVIKQDLGALGNTLNALPLSQDLSNRFHKGFRFNGFFEKGLRAIID